MSEYNEYIYRRTREPWGWSAENTGEQIVRCKDCKHLDMPDWDDNLAACYGEPPLFCMRLSYNEWRMDGDRLVADPTILEVEPDDFCAWGERKVDQ